MSKYFFKSVIFDLDGVVTKTARVHFQSWKLVFDEYLRLRQKRDNEPFREFTHEDDYLPFVDGKPRYKGVESFLESRGINIPFGDPSDSPDIETACGIGNKKNTYFCKALREEGAEIYPSTVEFIKHLRKAGVRIGVASSSKNCQEILQSVDSEDLFEVRVDGVVSEQLGLKGKPEADIFVKAANSLEAVPANSVIVEDATSGVQAGRRGGFGLVIGVARKNNIDELLDNGADVAVEDLARINPEWIESWFHKTPGLLLQCWNTPNQVLNTSGAPIEATSLTLNPSYFRSGKSVFFAEKRLVLFLDYDGTLTPIVSRPELAVLSQEMKTVLGDLSERYTVALVSGRARHDVEKLAGLKGIFYAGSHGFDIRGPEISMVEPRAKDVIPLIADIVSKLRENLGAIEGILIEEKKFSVAVHYRLVEDKNVGGIKNFVDGIVKNNNSLRLMCGKKVYEILPAIDWDKGKAVRWIMQALGVSWDNASIVYIGDDTTDEDAFRAIGTRGTGILVFDKPRESAACFRLSSPDEVKKLFEMILE